MTLLHQQLQAQLQIRDQKNLRRTRHTVSTSCMPHITVDSRAILSFASNDYLGLASHPRIIESLREGALMYGAGSGASHLICGHSQAHALLENRLAKIFASYIPSARSLYFCTGYMANLAIMTGLIGEYANDAMIFSEQLNHASIIDGIRLSRAPVQIYPHKDMTMLASMLAASDAKTKIVVTDSVFSMDGDIALIEQLVALCEKYHAWLVIDDAHGFGVLGHHGHGVLEHAQISSPNIIYMGTLGKAAGVGGAFVVADAVVIDCLIQRARAYIYTTAAPPLLAHALLTALDIIEGPEGIMRRDKLRDLMGQLKNKIKLFKWDILYSESAIVPIIIGDNKMTLDAATYLMDEGMWVPAIRPPTVPDNTARLRITLSALHTNDDVSRLASTIMLLEKKLLC